MSSPLPAFSSQVTDASYATLDMAPRAVPGLSVSCVGRERCLPGYRVARDGYGCHALEFVVEGAGTLTLDGHHHRLRAGQLFTYGPGISHVIESDPRRPLVKYFVDFFGRSAASACRDANLGPPALVSVDEPAAVRSLFEELLREAQKKDHSARPELTVAYLRLIFLKTRERSLSQNAPAPAPSSRAHDTLQRALRVIETRHVELNTLADLAASAQVDAAHLCRLFSRFRHDTPYRCLSRRKLDAAARLLSTQPVLIKEAAAAAGFDDPLHFSKIFHRAFGCSPRDFQTRHHASIARPRKE